MNKTQQKFRIEIVKDQEICCGTYLKDQGLSLGLLLPDGDAFAWHHFLRTLKNGDCLVIQKIRQIEKKGVLQPK